MAVNGRFTPYNDDNGTGGAMYVSEEEIERLNKQLKNTSKCEWKEDNSEEDVFYETGCGSAYSLVEGTLEENNHKFCPYCGGRIQAIRAVINEYKKGG